MMLAPTLGCRSASLCKSDETKFSCNFNKIVISTIETLKISQFL